MEVAAQVVAAHHCHCRDLPAVKLQGYFLSHANGSKYNYIDTQHFE